MTHNQPQSMLQTEEMIDSNFLKNFHDGTISPRAFYPQDGQTQFNTPMFGHQGQQLTYNASGNPNLDFMEFSNNNHGDMDQYFREQAMMAAPPPFSGASGDVIDPGMLMQRQMFEQRPQYGNAPMFSNRLGDNIGHQAYAQPQQQPQVDLKQSRSGRSINPNTTMQHGQVTPVLSPANSQGTNNETKDKRKISELSQTSQSTGSTSDEVLPPKPKRGRRKKNKILTEDEKNAQRERFLERNRNAAAKCRTNKKKWQENLKDQVKELQQENHARMAQFADLQAEYDRMRNYIVSHSRMCPNSADLGKWMDEHAANVFGPPAMGSPLPHTPLDFDILDSDDESSQSHARINEDYTDKRTIALPDRPMVSAVDRPRSAPHTPGGMNIDSSLAASRRHNSFEMASGMPMDLDRNEIRPHHLRGRLSEHDGLSPDQGYFTSFHDMRDESRT